MLKKDSRFEDIKIEGRHFLPNRKHQLEIDLDKLVYKDAKVKSIKSNDSRDDLPQGTTTPKLNRRYIDLDIS